MKHLIVCLLLIVVGCDSNEQGVQENKDYTAVPRPFSDTFHWGYLDNQGKVVIRPQFTRAEDFYEGLALVSTRNRDGYIRPDGSWAVILPKGAYPVGRFSEGRAWFRQGDLYGCVDSEGNIIIPPTYDWVKPFSEGLAAVSTGSRASLDSAPQDSTERYGYVDRTGRVVIPPKYKYANSFGNGLAMAVPVGETGWQYIDHSGKMVFTLDNLPRDPRNFVGSAPSFVEGWAAVSFDGNGPGVPYGRFLNTTGQLVGRRYRAVRSFSEGLAAVWIPNKEGFKVVYVDTELRVVIPLKFDGGASFNEGLCLVRIGSDWKYIDRRGKVVAQCGKKSEVWNDVESFHGGLARVHIGGKFKDTDDGPAYWTGGKWCYIDRDGKIVADCRQDGAGPPSHFFGDESAGPTGWTPW